MTQIVWIFLLKQGRENLLTGHDGLCPQSRLLSREKRSESQLKEDH